MDAKVIQKYGKRSTKDLKKRAIFWFHKFIRLRDCDENGFANCISSGQQLKFGTKNCQAGHFYPAGKIEALRFNENNVHIQGLSDNYFASADLHNYRRRLIEKIGEEAVKKLDLMADQSKRTMCKRDRFFYIEIIEKYKAECKILAEDKNFKVN